MAKYPFLLFVTGLFVTGIAFTVTTAAQEQATKVVVQADGLTCPFCSFGLEKKLKKLAGAEAVTIRPDQALVEVIFAPGSVIDQTETALITGFSVATRGFLQVIEKSGDLPQGQEGELSAFTPISSTPYLPRQADQSLFGTKWPLYSKRPIEGQ